jgi:hypothetical protein
LYIALRNSAFGFGGLLSVYKQPNLRCIIMTILIILITAESISLLTAEIVDLIFYKYSILLSVPLALLAGAFTAIAPEDYRKMKSSSQ